MISTCILPHIEAVSNVHNVNAIKESPHETMEKFIQMAWGFSTGFGIILFLLEITIICWMQFVTKNRGAAIASTVVVVPVIVLFLIFAAHFYRRLISHKSQRAFDDFEDLERIAHEVENHAQMENLQTSSILQTSSVQDV